MESSTIKQRELVAMSDRDAERRLLVAALSDERLAQRLCYDLSPEDFSNWETRVAYSVMRTMLAEGTSITPFSVSSALVKAGHGDLVATYAMPSPDLFLLGGEVDQAIDHVIAAGQRRRLRSLAEQIIAAADAGGDPEQLVEQLIGHSYERAYQRRPSVSLSASITELADAMESGDDGRAVYMDLGDLDVVCDGLRPGQLIVIGAPPGGGKTGLLSHICLHVARCYGPVLMLSQEMSRTELAKRVVACVEGVNSRAVTVEMCRRQAEKLWSVPLEVIDQRLRASELLMECRAFAVRHPKLALIGIDYLQLTNRDKGDHSKELEFLSWFTPELKGLAKDLSAPVVLLSQLSRDGRKAGRRPCKEDLRGSGTIEQDADKIILLHPDEDQPEDSLWAIVDKNRSGPTGAIRLHYDRRSQRYSQWGRQVSAAAKQPQRRDRRLSAEHQMVDEVL